MMSELSRILRTRRQELGLTLAQIAEKMGVAEATVQRWESGTIRSIRYDKITKLADILHVAPAELMGWRNSDEKLAAPSAAALRKDGLTDAERELIKLLRRLPPSSQDAILQQLRGLALLQEAQDASESK